MSAPIVTISETTEMREIAGLLTAHRIERVPLLRNGKIADILSRADLARAMAAAGLESADHLRRSNPTVNWLEKIDQLFAQLRPRLGRKGRFFRCFGGWRFHFCQESINNPSYCTRKRLWYN